MMTTGLRQIIHLVLSFKVQGEIYLNTKYDNYEHRKKRDIG